MKKIVFIFVFIFCVYGADSEAQLISAGRNLDVNQVKNEIEARLARGAGEAAIWNTGYDFFRNYPKNQDTAMAIHKAFLGAKASTTEQQKILLKAAVYWEKIHDYGIANVPVGIDNNTRDNIYYGSTAKQSTLAMRRPVGGPVPYYDSQGPPRNYERKPPYKGRPDNPYPGKYYSGIYPP